MEGQIRMVRLEDENGIFSTERRIHFIFNQEEAVELEERLCEILDTNLLTHEQRAILKKIYDSSVKIWRQDSEAGYYNGRDPKTWTYDHDATT